MPTWLAPMNNEALYRMLRECMVERQLLSRGILDARVLAAMQDIPRHAFVPPHLRACAYDDTPLSIGHDQVISQPLMVAVMLQALALDGHERVLEVGTGSGYQAALLSRLAAEVHTVEIVPVFIELARQALAATRCERVTVVEGDGCMGCSEAAPYDAIVVAAAVPKVPEPLIDQLRVGGCLVVPVGDGDLQNLLRVHKHDDAIQIEDLGVCAFLPLAGAYGAGGNHAHAGKLREVRAACRQVGALLARIGPALDPRLRERLECALYETCVALDASSILLASRRAERLTCLVDEATASLGAFTAQRSA